MKGNNCSFRHDIDKRGKSSPSNPSQNSKTRMVSVLSKCSFAHRQVDAQPTKWSKSNNVKSAVALLKKGDWHERGSVTDRYHDRSGRPDKRSDKKLGRNSSKRQLSDARQLGCVFQDMTPPKSILRKSTDMPKTVQEGYCASYQNSRPKSSLG